MDILHLDYETRSCADLKSVGAFRYAEDESTCILLCAIALNDEAPVVWRADGKYPSTTELGKVFDLLKLASGDRSDILIYAHNAQFEVAISDALFQRTFALPPPSHDRWRCTAAMARRAALPASLEKIAEYLGLQQQKDKRGASLIRKFSTPQKPSKKMPEGGYTDICAEKADFDLFAEYCAQDVRTEQDVHKRLRAFDLTDKDNSLATFQLDLAINSRGLAVNVEGLQLAEKLRQEESERLSAEFTAMTGFNITQNAKLLEWCKEQGQPMPNLQAATLEETMDDMNFDESSEVGKALKLRQRFSYASVKKIPAMLKCASPADGRVRGSILYHGPTTGRWSGRLIQPQNFKRPTVKLTEPAYADLCAGMDRDTLEMIYGPPLEVLSSCIRHFIHDRAGPMLDADYASIEARIVCWLAGEEWALEEYRQGVDRYKTMASSIFSKPAATIDKTERFVGKIAVLGCGYGMGATKYAATCAQFGQEIEPELAEVAVKAFRAKHAKLVSLWYLLERSCKAAILAPGSIRKAGDHLEVFVANAAGRLFLFIRLPSRRLLCYPEPQIKDDRITFYGQRPLSTLWGRCDTYGGKLVENVTQAVAADVMACGAINAETHGYEIATLIHDEALAYFKPDAGQTVEEFCRLLTTLPRWASGLPIEAEGQIVPFYKK